MVKYRYFPEKPAIPDNLPGPEVPPIHKAAENGDVYKARQLINEDPAVVKVINRPSFGEQPLHTAALYGRVGVAKLLIENGADVNARTLLLSTPLHCAAKHAHRSVALALIKAGAELNPVDAEGRTPLHMAITQFSDEGDAFRAALIKQGANIDVYAAACMGREDLVRGILSNNPSTVRESLVRDQIIVDCWLMIMFCAAYSTRTLREVFEGYESMMTALMDAGAPIASALASIVHYDTDDAYFTSFLLSHGADVNAPGSDGQLPLTVARARGNEAVIKVLLEKGAHE